MHPSFTGGYFSAFVFVVISKEWESKIQISLFQTTTKKQNKTQARLRVKIRVVRISSRLLLVCSSSGQRIITRVVSSSCSPRWPPVLPCDAKQIGLVRSLFGCYNIVNLSIVVSCVRYIALISPLLLWSRDNTWSVPTRCRTYLARAGS